MARDMGDVRGKTKIRGLMWGPMSHWCDGQLETGGRDAQRQRSGEMKPRLRWANCRVVKVGKGSRSVLGQRSDEKAIVGSGERRGIIEWPVVLIDDIIPLKN